MSYKYTIYETTYKASILAGLTRNAISEINLTPVRKSWIQKAKTIKSFDKHLLENVVSPQELLKKLERESARIRRIRIDMGDLENIQKTKTGELEFRFSFELTVLELARKTKGSNGVEEKIAAPSNSKEPWISKSRPTRHFRSSPKMQKLTLRGTLTADEKREIKSEYSLLVKERVDEDFKHGCFCMDTPKRSRKRFDKKGKEIHLKRRWIHKQKEQYFNEEENYDPASAIDFGPDDFFDEE